MQTYSKTCQSEQVVTPNKESVLQVRWNKVSLCCRVIANVAVSFVLSKSNTRIRYIAMMETISQATIKVDGHFIENIERENLRYTLYQSRSL